MSLRITGTAGELRKGYQVVARLGRWSMDQKDRCDAAIVELNTFWVDQPGSCALWLRMGTNFWVWRNIEVLNLNGSFSAHVKGSQEIHQ